MISTLQYNLVVVFLFGVTTTLMCFVMIAEKHNSLDWMSSVRYRAIPIHKQRLDSESMSDSYVSTTESTQSNELTQYFRYELPALRPNVLFMMTDDMRAQLGCYQKAGSPLHSPRIYTPNLDALASKSLLLTNAFVQYSLCGPSRTSMLTSRRPDTTRIFDNRHYWRKHGGNFTTLPQYFKENGYVSYGIGKVFHEEKSSNNNDPISWSEPYIMPRYSDASYVTRHTEGWLPVTKQDRAKIEITDTLSLLEAQRILRKLAHKARTGEKPFFMALGFRKPHSLYVCPKEYFDLYDVETEEEFLSEVPWDKMGFKYNQNLMNVSWSTEGKPQMSDETMRQLRRAYFACMSYVDSLVGSIVQTLHELQLSESTIISFIADHGYHFGENGLYGKQSLYDISTRVPLMLHIPGRTDHGVVSNSIVEALDLFPTLVEATGLSAIAPCPTRMKHPKLCTQGKSFLPLIAHPKANIKPAAITQKTAPMDYMRYSIRTKRFRYTEWIRYYRQSRPDGTYRVELLDALGQPTELYDYREDPSETNNLANDRKYERIKVKLKTKLHATISEM